MAKKPFLKTKAGSVVTIVIGIVLIFVIGSEYRAYQARKAIKDIFQNAFNTATPEPAKNKNIIEKKVGEEFELATVKVKVNGIEEKQIINAPYSEPNVAKEKAKFVVLDLDITNTTKDSFVFGPEGINIVDSQERNFGVYNQYVGLNNNLEYKELSPNITLNGVLVYELPNDATSYALAIDKAGTNDRYMVKLK